MTTLPKSVSLSPKVAVILKSSENRSVPSVEIKATRLYLINTDGIRLAGLIFVIFSARNSILSLLRGKFRSAHSIRDLAVRPLLFLLFTSRKVVWVRGYERYRILSRFKNPLWCFLKNR